MSARPCRGEGWGEGGVRGTYVRSQIVGNVRANSPIFGNHYEVNGYFKCSDRLESGIKGRMQKK